MLANKRPPPPQGSLIGLVIFLCRRPFPVQRNALHIGRALLLPEKGRCAVLGRLARRLRYYQASLDVAALGKGRDYDRLPDTYVAFICTGDFLGTGRPVSTLDIRCREVPDFDCGHGFRWVILNASRWHEIVPGPLRDLLAFVDTGRIPDNDGLIGLIESEMAEANANARWKESMMPFLTVEDDARIQARIRYEDGKAEGRSEGEATMAALMERLFAEGRLDDARQAAIDTGTRARLLKEYGL